MEMDDDIAHAHGDQVELEYRWRLADHPGTARLLGYMNHAHMGNYVESVQNPTPKGVDITATREYRVKYGAGLNLEQEILPSLGAFARLGWNDGHTETWAFTEVDSTASAGLSWRPFAQRADRAGLAGIYNEISPEHRAYLAAGGLGFIIGDGGLNYAPEEILETYYSFRVSANFSVSLDGQYISHPGYNQDHGPVPAGALRLHGEF
jgi:high affinity Mn2+ porin